MEEIKKTPKWSLPSSLPTNILQKCAAELTPNDTLVAIACALITVSSSTGLTLNANRSLTWPNSNGGTYLAPDIDQRNEIFKNLSETFVQFGTQQGLFADLHECQQIGSGLVIEHILWQVKMDAAAKLANKTYAWNVAIGRLEKENQQEIGLKGAIAGTGMTMKAVPILRKELQEHDAILKRVEKMHESFTKGAEQETWPTHNKLWGAEQSNGWGDLHNRADDQNWQAASGNRGVWAAGTCLSEGSPAAEQQEHNQDGWDYDNGQNDEQNDEMWGLYPAKFQTPKAHRAVPEWGDCRSTGRNDLDDDVKSEDNWNAGWDSAARYYHRSVPLASTNAREPLQNVREDISSLGDLQHNGVPPVPKQGGRTPSNYAASYTDDRLNSLWRIPASQLFHPVRASTGPVNHGGFQIQAFQVNSAASVDLLDLPKTKSEHAAVETINTTVGPSETLVADISDTASVFAVPTLIYRSTISSVPKSSASLKRKQGFAQLHHDQAHDAMPAPVPKEPNKTGGLQQQASPSIQIQSNQQSCLDGQDAEKRHHYHASFSSK